MQFIKIKKGQIWCVYDKDSFPPEHFNGVEQRADNLNKENPELQYHTAWSNECIEFWLIIPGLFEPPVRTLRATIPENESHIFR